MNYIGIPFKDKGRDFKGCDCFGLVKLYYKNELGIEIPETNITADQPKRIMINYLNEISKNWTKIESPEKNCVVAFAMHEEHPKLVTHFAVMIDDKTILHTLNKSNSHKLSIDDIRVKSFIRGYFKWQN